MTNQQKADRIISVYCDGDVNEAWRENMRTVIKSALDAVVKEKDNENLRLRELLKRATGFIAEPDTFAAQDSIDCEKLLDEIEALTPKGEPQ